jgi:hypothetical protein
MGKKEMIKEETKEHPKFSKKQINQIVVDHLKKHITELTESPEEEGSEDDGFNTSEKSNKFSKMKKMKDDIEAENAGAND